jgi:hypothetical protein
MEWVLAAKARADFEGLLLQSCPVQCDAMADVWWKLRKKMFK